MHGLIRYGSYGLSSDLIDSDTRELRYQRQVDDVEVIPLYYRFWIPVGGNIGFLAHQSYESRSCVSLVNIALADFYNRNSEFRRLTIGKVLPIDERAFENAKVKKVSLIKRNVSSDRADGILGDLNQDIDIELTFSAKRRRALGIYTDILGRFGDGDAARALEFEGESYDTATAEILIGKNRQKVGLLGYSGNAGVIDVTDDLDFEEGHPTFESISEKAKQLITDFNLEYS